MPTRNIKTYSKKGKINKVTNNLKFGSLLNFDQNTIKKNVHKTKVYNTRSKYDIDVSLESKPSVYVTNLTSDESIRATWAETTFDKLKRNSCCKITNQCKKVNKKLTKQKKTENKVCELSAPNSTGNTIEGEGIGDHQLIIEKKKDHSPDNSLHLELTQCATRPEFAWNLSKSQSFQINVNPRKDKENSKNIFSSTLIDKQYSHPNISHCFKNISTVASTPFKKSNNNLTSLFCVSPIPTTSNSVFENSLKKIPSILEEQSLDNDIDLSMKKSIQDFSSDLFSTQSSCCSDNEINKNSSFQYKRQRERNNNSDCCTALEEDAVYPKIVKKKDKSPPFYRSSIEFIKSINLDDDSLKNSKCISSLHENSKINVNQDKNLNPITVDSRTIPIVLIEKLSDYEIMKYSKNVKLHTSISKQNSSKKKSKPIIQPKVIEKHKTCSKGKLNVSTSKKIRDNLVPALISTPKNTSKYLNYNKNTNGIIGNQVLTLSLTPINIAKYLNHSENTSFVLHNTSIRENSTTETTDFISSNSSLSVNVKEFNDFEHGFNSSIYIHNENDSKKNMVTLSQDNEIVNDTCASFLDYSHNSKDNSSQFELSLNESIVIIDKNSKLINQSVINISDEESVNYEVKSTKRISNSVINILSENIVNRKKLPLINVVNSSLSSEEHDSFLEYNETRSETPIDSINNKSAVNVNFHESQNDEEHILSSININEPVTNTSLFNSLQMDNSLTCEEQNFTFKSLQSESEKIKESEQIINTSIDNKVIQSNNKNISEQIVSKINHKLNDSQLSSGCLQIKNSIILKPGKKWRRSLAILRSPKLKEQNRKGKKWLENIIEIMKMQPEYSKQTLSLETLPQNINEKNMRRHSEFPYSRLSKRFSVRIVQEEKYSEKDNFKLSDLKSYATSINDIADKRNNADISKGYESKANHCGTQFHDLYDITNSLNELRLSPSSLPSQKEDREFVSARKIVLQRCDQDEPLSFENIYSDSVLKKCHKIGEGVYGEVYLLKEPNGTATVLKVIPIEGDITVNGESQKKFNEVLSEIIISQELSALRQGFYNKTSCFVEVKRIKCVQGCYPNRLTELWELYDEDRGSENDHPSIFPDDQLYIVFELAHGGQDLEGFKFLNAEQSYSVFLQAVFALAVAESELNFEHRDLHWGNLLVSYTSEREIIFNIKGEEFRVRSNGVKAVIIDFTLSRCTFDGCCIYNDLSEDQDLFTSDGDYQFEVYRLMQKKNGNEWGHFEPYTNILWLRYIILKMIDGARYTREVSKKHKSHIVMMQSIEPSILTFANAELLAKSGILKQL